MKNRHPDWRARLNSFLAENEAAPFVWGKWDCCIGLFAGAVKLIRSDGKDYAVGWRGTYSGKLGAFKQLRRKAGVDTPAELMTQFFGEAKPPAFARTGDVVSYEGCIGIMHGGEGVFIGCEMMGGEYVRDGLVRVPRTELEACWHV